MPPSSYVRHSDRSNCVAPPSRATMRIGSRDLAGGWAVHEDGTSRASARSENDGRSSPLLSCGDWLQRSSAATAFGSGGASDVAEASCAPARAACIAPATRTHKSDGHVEGGRLWPSLFLSRDGRPPSHADSSWLGPRYEHGAAHVRRLESPASSVNEAYTTSTHQQDGGRGRRGPRAMADSMRAWRQCITI